MVCRIDQAVVQPAQLGVRARLVDLICVHCGCRLADVACGKIQQSDDGLVPADGPEFSVVSIVLCGRNAGFGVDDNIDLIVCGFGVHRLKVAARPGIVPVYVAKGSPLN